jgi:hypothetical protein
MAWLQPELSLKDWKMLFDRERRLPLLQSS